MSAAPRFFSQPLRYLRWAAIEKPAIFFSLAVGSAGPVILLTVPRIRSALGDEPRPQIPLTYPIPTTPRKSLTGYDDE
ncbi:n19m, NADH-ubiquinone oxidoreductase 9.5 kDa subunit [Clarireedia jacksonii]